MSYVKLSDCIIPTEFTKAVVDKSTVGMALLDCGVMSLNGVMQQQLQAGADSWTNPLFHDLDDSLPNIGDDSENESTPHKISAVAQRVRKQFLNNSWSSANLASEMISHDVMGVISTRVADYWKRYLQRALVSQIKGVIAHNVANDNSDIVHDISKNIGLEAVIGGGSVIDAALTAGDRLSEFTGILMHSVTYARCLKTSQVEFVPVGTQSITMPKWQGMAVIVSDEMPIDGDVYTTVLFKAGALGFAVAEPKFADGTEIESKPSMAMGAGISILHSRLNIATGVNGYSFLDNAVVGVSPTLAELANPTNYKRVTDRKNIGMAVLKHLIEQPVAKAKK